jgi:hypothetical protein
VFRRVLVGSSQRNPGSRINNLLGRGSFVRLVTEWGICPRQAASNEDQDCYYSLSMDLYEKIQLDCKELYDLGLSAFSNQSYACSI